MRLFGFPPRLDGYVARITIGSFLVCFFFIVGLFVLVDLFGNIDDFTKNLEKLPDDYRRYGFFLVIAYYLTNLPFVYLIVAPFVTVTAGMFAVSRLMGSNEVVPMLFIGRRLGRVLLPVFLLGVGNALLMVGLREFVLPKLVVAKDNLKHMLDSGQVERAVSGTAIPLPQGVLLFFDNYQVKSEVLGGVNLRIPIEGGPGEASISADRAKWTDGTARGPGWLLTNGRETRPDSLQGKSVEFLPENRIDGFHPEHLRARIKERQELMDLSYSSLTKLVAEQPNVREFTVALHHQITFPLANVLLLLLALPFALSFERGSKTERVFFALLICAAYLVTDLICQNLGKTGTMHPVLAAWFPTVLFGSLGIVMFDTART